MSDIDSCFGPSAILARMLVKQGFSPFFGTPCGILAPLYSALEREAQLHTIPREDAAIGVAAGTAVAGSIPVVIMQNSGLGQSVNALASLVVPYQIPMLLIVSIRGIMPDTTPENFLMGRITELLLKELGIPAARIDEAKLESQVSWAHKLVGGHQRPAALLVTPQLFGWHA